MPDPRSPQSVAVLLVALGPVGALSAAADKPLTPPELRFFESSVRPLLIEHCYRCHSADAERIRGGLRVDTREALLRGGASGAAITPGDPDGSLLIRAIRYEDEDTAMPPKGKLPAEAIRVLEEWVRMGAPDPRREEAAAIEAEAPIDIEAGRAFWAFRPPERPAPPRTKNEAWPRGEIDRFLLAAMEADGLEPVKDAERRTWLRRVTFDLTGLPPTPEESLAFDLDTSPQAREKVVDRLLASPAFGERWGRHWLDVARYAESSGKENNVLYPHAWRYRDYVIASFNADKPYDLFLKEQIAGDLLPYDNARERADNLVATAYLALGPKSHNAPNRTQFTFDLVDEQIDALTQGLIGLTVSCARCHDHKFDPIPQRDYYAMAGIFLSSSTQFGTIAGPGNRHASGLVRLPEEADVLGPALPPQRRSILERAKRRIEEQAERASGEIGGDPVNRVRIQLLRSQARTLESILERFDESGRPTRENAVTMGVLEGTRTIDAPILQRGEIDKPGERVPRGFVQVVQGSAPTTISEGSGRRELAEWIADPAHPLTARVWVNRVWLHLFGEGIVPTPDNFGMSGLPPRNQALLDYLAIRFVELGWSTKALVREIVLSRAYGLSSDHHAGNHAIDPENTRLWRMPKKRLEAEAIRDAMLAAAGTLRRDHPLGSPINFAEGALRGDNRLTQALLEYAEPVRSVYLPIVRERLPEFLEAFDFADPSFVVGDRAKTNVATQALFLMNDAEVIAASEAFATRVLAGASGERERIVLAFELALGRKPTSDETIICRSFLKEARAAASEAAPPAAPARRGRRAAPARPDPAAAERSAWALLCQSLFQTAEFRTLD
jgi:hypothetical protein